MNVIVLTPEELEAVVRKAVRAELDVRGGDGPGEILTRAGVAKLLDVHERTVTAYVRKRGLPAVQLGGGEWRFRRSAVLEWLGSQKGRA